MGLVIASYRSILNATNTYVDEYVTKTYDKNNLLKHISLKMISKEKYTLK